MTEEKDRYRAPTTRQAARSAAIPAGNLGQKADPTDKSTESLHRLLREYDVPALYLLWSARIPAIYLGPPFRRSRPSPGGGPLTVAYHAQRGPGGPDGHMGGSAAHVPVLPTRGFLPDELRVGGGDAGARWRLCVPVSTRLSFRSAPG
jgi:hypothetical protein